MGQGLVGADPRWSARPTHGWPLTCCYRCSHAMGLAASPASNVVFCTVLILCSKKTNRIGAFSFTRLGGDRFSEGPTFPPPSGCDAASPAPPPEHMRTESHPTRSVKGSPPSGHRRPPVDPSEGISLRSSLLSWGSTRTTPTRRRRKSARQGERVIPQLPKKPSSSLRVEKWTPTPGRVLSLAF